MSDRYFVVQADRPLKPEQPWYYIPGLKTEMMTDLGMLPPTAASIAHGVLEWKIPNTQYNQGWISLHYSHFKILREGQERTEVDDIPVMPGMPEPLEPEEITAVPEGPGDINETLPPSPEPEPESVPAPAAPEPAVTPAVPETPAPIPESAPSMIRGGLDYFAVPTDPIEVKQLKAHIKAKLSELEVQAPENSTLKTLQELLKARLM